jgi:two-component system chemotaxis sensor kinase CheA
VDHGIEGKEARTNSGKSEMGTVQLKAFHQSGSLVVEVQDDGAGLDPDKLIQKAVEKGLIKAGTSLTPKEAYNLIFLSGFSTKAAVTDISGRGVGMDVVKTNIQQLQGDLQIDTVYGKGTCFRIKLPLTLAIIDGMIIRSKEERYIIPLSHVHESLRPTEEDIHPVTGIGHVLSLRGETLPLYHLSVLLGKKSSTNTKPSDQIAIVIRTQAQPFSVLVDDIVGQHQIVVKQLGSEHKNLRGFSGSAILGDGKPSLILEMGELVKRHGGTSMNITQPIRRATA